jgi:pimeloyl-ACP methyl ester carboxylesterase
VFLEEQAKLGESGRSPTDASVLAKLEIPVLLLLGTRSCQWFGDSVRHIAQHLPRASVREIPNAEHFGPHTAASTVADELVHFFDATRAR